MTSSSTRQIPANYPSYLATHQGIGRSLSKQDLRNAGFEDGEHLALPIAATRMIRPIFRQTCPGEQDMVSAKGLPDAGSIQEAAAARAGLLHQPMFSGLLRPMYEILKRHWVASAAFMAAALLLMAPVLHGTWPIALMLIFLHSPAYMAHQVEEHLGDRFRTYVNQKLCGGREGLTSFDVIWINVGMVWGLNLAALYLARFGDIGWTLVAPYMLVVNAASHIGWAIRFRSYNPGLATSILLFLPLGAVTLFVIPASGPQHLTGFGLAIALHALIIINLMKRLRS